MDSFHMTPGPKPRSLLDAAWPGWYGLQGAWDFECFIISPCGYLGMSSRDFLEILCQSWSFPKVLARFTRILWNFVHQFPPVNTRCPWSCLRKASHGCHGPAPASPCRCIPGGHGRSPMAAAAEGLQLATLSGGGWTRPSLGIAPPKTERWNPCVKPEETTIIKN